MLRAQTSNPVGAIPGAIDVSHMGAVTYTIPIEVVPGTQGMQPNLSIVYNSFSGMGLLGMKWGLAGLSAITRCGQTPYYEYWDNKGTTAIQFNTNDRFALDGNRLNPTSYGFYWDDKIEYATEMEDFTRIIPYSKKIGHPDYFIAHTDGGIIEYGNSDDSKQIVGTDKVLSWFVNKVTDANNNYMTFHYERSAAGEIWISEIAYTGNASTMEPYAKVKFNYTALPDNLGRNTYFVGGYGIPQTQLLKTITVYYIEKEGERIVRQYLFNYVHEDKNVQGERTAHLKEIVLYGENKAEQLNATVIDWGVQNTSIEVSEQIDGLPNGYVLTGDFNGDGYTDIIFYGMGSNQDIWQLHLGNSYDASFTFERGGTHQKTYPPNQSTPHSYFYVSPNSNNGKDGFVIAEKILGSNHWNIRVIRFSCLSPLPTIKL